ncbi:MAG: hypothetical protein NXH95_03705 [Pseudomonadaceae bacterium]|nr:hypothetical protein [Pseudomonadaceae bacterium]
MSRAVGTSGIVNDQAYPIADSLNTARKELVERLRAELEENLYCVLPEFVTPEALAAMTQEAKDLQPYANHNNSLRNCYLHRQKDETFPDDHARNLQDRSSVRMIAYDQLAEESVLKAFYHSEDVRQLVSEIVNEGNLYENEDPYQPANYVCYQSGDESSWHFDADNSFTMTLMIQPSSIGGEFQMSPNTRSDSEQNYSHVSAVLQGQRDDTIVAVGREPGALCIFKGCNSLHRVTPVEGDVLRIMGVFVYEFSPGVVGDPEVNATIYGSHVAAKSGV